MLSIVLDMADVLVMLSFVGAVDDATTGITRRELLAKIVIGVLIHLLILITTVIAILVPGTATAFLAIVTTTAAIVAATTATATVAATTLTTTTAWVDQRWASMTWMLGSMTTMTSTGCH